MTVLKIDPNLDIKSVKNSLARSLNKDISYKNYTLEVSLIYKIIHEHSNYEDYQWELYGYEKGFVEAELKSLLFKISIFVKLIPKEEDSIDPILFIKVSRLVLTFVNP